jgi:beta-glucosidase
VPVPIEEGQPINIVVEHTIRRLVDAESLSFTFGVQLDGSEPERLIAESVSAAATADLAVVVVGTTSSLESEGFDRTSLALPGLQDELVHRVAEANPKTVVVVNAGAPVTMPWHDNVAAILLSWFGGQEFSHALTDVLTGTTEPGGRLPTTWPASIDDVPVPRLHPGQRCPPLHRRHQHRLPRVVEDRGGTRLPVRLWPRLHELEPRATHGNDRHRRRR